MLMMEVEIEGRASQEFGEIDRGFRVRRSWIFGNCWLRFSELPALEQQADVTGDSFSDLWPPNFTNSHISLSFFLLKLFTHQSCVLSNMLYSLHSRYSRPKMKVLLQFRFVGDTAKKKKKKKQQLT